MPGLGAVELVMLAVVLLVRVLIVGAVITTAVILIRRAARGTQQQSPGPDPRHRP